MSDSGTFVARNAAVLAVAAIDAPIVVTSDEIDSRLADAYKRVGMRPGLLGGLAGIRERRWWGEGTSFIDGAVMAGAKALAEAGVAPEDVGLLINASVSRAHLEPATSVVVHDGIGLPPTCQNFDVTNACLGFVNGMQIAAAMIDAGQCDYALIVAGEDARPAHEASIARLGSSAATAKDVMAEFATLTLGSGAAAVVMGRADLHAGAHRMVRGINRAATAHHDLCVGDVELMRTDSSGLMRHGIRLSEDLWGEARSSFDWNDPAAMYVIHQVSQVHTNAICRALEIDPALVPRTFPTRGNIGPASVPFTLAANAHLLKQDDAVMLMGIGSGLNACCVELRW